MAVAALRLEALAPARCVVASALVRSSSSAWLRSGAVAAGAAACAGSGAGTDGTRAWIKEISTSNFTSKNQADFDHR